MPAPDFEQQLKRFARSYVAAGKVRPFGYGAKGAPLAAGGAAEDTARTEVRRRMIATFAMRYILQQFEMDAGHDAIELVPP